MPETVRKPKQKRSIETKKKIKESAVELITEKGYHAANSNLISSHAGINIGTFYSYYKDKKMLLVELLIDFQEAYFKKVFAEPVEAVNDFADISGIVEKYILKSIEAFQIGPGIFREAYALQYNDEEIKEIFSRYEKMEIEGIFLLLKNFQFEGKNSDLKRTAIFIHSIIATMLNRYHFLGLGMKKEILARELASMILVYLKEKVSLSV